MDYSIYMGLPGYDALALLNKDAHTGPTSSSDLGDVITFPAESNPPQWLKSISHSWPDLLVDDLYSARSGAIVALSLDDVTFLISFGTAHLHIDRAKIIHDFGRKVVVNSVSADNLKQVSRQAIDGTRSQSVEQTPRAERLSSYGIDYERDLLRGLAGVPRKRAFGPTISGSDALHVRVEGGFEAVKARLRLYRRAYFSRVINPELRSYDRLKKVTDGSLLSKLNLKLDKAIGASSANDPVLVIPEIRDRSAEFLSYGFSHSSKKHPAARYPDPTLDDWRHWLLAHKGITASLASARTNDFYTYDGSGEDLSCFTILDCLVWTVFFEDVNYYLQNGVWYCIDASLVTAVANFMRVLYRNKTTIAWPPYTGGDEGSYNTNAALAIPGMILVDRSNITLVGAKTAVEPCDLIDIAGKTLVFVKRKKSGSTGLGHLLAQVLVGVDAFFSHDSEMRVAMAKRFKPPQPSFSPQHQPEGRQWTVVILILGVQKRGLPFFSQLATKRVVTTLTKRYGVDVCLEYA